MATPAKSSSGFGAVGRVPGQAAIERGIRVRLSPRVKAALTMLLKSYVDAESPAGPGARPTLELATLRHLGLSHRDLRWLVGRGLIVEWATGAQPGDVLLNARPPIERTFSPGTLFCLTPQGVHVARELPDSLGPRLRETGKLERQPAYLSTLAAAGSTPKWDRNRNELQVGSIVVKRFNLGAPDQETILAAFEEALWPHGIQNPLSIRGDRPPERRLHETVAALNRQRQPLVQFSTGDGQMVCWQFSDALRKLSQH